MIFFNRVDMLLQLFRLSRAPNHKELKMKKRSQWLTVGVLLMAGQAAFSQIQAPALPTQRVSLSASATVQVPQDELTLTLSTQREGSHAPDVQNQLKAALDAALTLARHQAQSPMLNVSTGRFGLSPRHDRNGKLIGWQGTAELVLQGRDFVRISQTAAQLQTLSVASVVFGLSAQQRQEAQAQAQSQAIEQFQKSASEIAKSFGFGGYTLGEIQVNANQMAPVRPYMMAASVRSMADEAAPVPMEAGLSQVSVNVSGSVQLK
jgi:predicted secreted protein